MRSDTSLWNKNEDTAKEEVSPGARCERCRDPSGTGTSSESPRWSADDNTDSQGQATPPPGSDPGNAPALSTCARRSSSGGSGL